MEVDLVNAIRLQESENMVNEPIFSERNNLKSR